MHPLAVASDAAPLDLHEGIDTLPDPLAGGCQRWPENLRLLNHSTGELHPGRCRATNLCPYCARLFAVETSEMLLLDAMEDAPILYAVLTAREYLDHAELRRHLTKLRKSLRKRWPDCRWAVLREYQRRGALHVNLTIKGVPASDREAFHEAWTALWCSRVDAEVSGQYTGVIADEVGLVKYVTLHFMKEAQAPGIGWRGHRYSATRDYLVRPAAVMRQEARRSLRLKRLLWRGVQLDQAELELAAAESTSWTLHHVDPSTVDPRREVTTHETTPSRRRDQGRPRLDDPGALLELRSPVPPRRGLAGQRRADRLPDALLSGMPQVRIVSQSLVTRRPPRSP